MRVLHAIASVDPSSGGPVEGIKQLSQALVQQGHTSEVACLDGPDSPWLAKFPFKAYALGPGVSGYRYSKWFVPWLQEHAANYDCIIVHGIWQYTSFGAWLALGSGSLPPYFVYTHGMLDPWFKRTYPLKHLKKWLYWPWADYRVLRDARAVLFTCEDERRLARQSFWLYQCREAVVNFGTAAPPGDAQVQRQVFEEHFPELRHKRLFLFLSRIHPKKGCDLLIQAFAAVARIDNSLHLVMAGPDQSGWQAQLQNQSEQLGIGDRLTWTGMLSGDLKWGAFRAAEAFILPSHQENFGVVVAEALACGLPVLISNKVNIWREIAADGAGFVANDDLAGTTDLLERWLSLPLDQQQAMQRQARQSFSERFEIHHAANCLVEALSAGEQHVGHPGTD